MDILFKQIKHISKEKQNAHFDTYSVSEVDDDEDPAVPGLAQFKFSYEHRNSHKSDVLDSISSSYEGTRKILADSEPRGPFYVPHDIKIDFQKDLPDDLPKDFSTDLPHPTVDLGIAMDEHVIAKREAEMEPMLVNVSLLQYLDTGRWFLSVSSSVVTYTGCSQS